MPFIMVDELGEGQEEAYVIDRNEYDAAVKTRDELLDRAVKAEDAYRALQEKYAKAVLSQPSPVLSQEPKHDDAPMTISDLFR